MVPIEPDLLSLLRLPVAIIAFLAPGWLLVRGLGSPAPVLTAVLASAAILLNTVVAVDALGIPLHAGSVGLALGLVTLAIVLVVYRRRGRAPTLSRPVLARPRGADWLWVGAVGAALASIALRAAVDPLSGYDNGTRWDYLARLMLATRSLGHYPPVSAEDFRFYSWCDGIPPLVPVLNFWTYAICNSVAPALTAARVVGEALLVGGSILRLAGRLWGPGAGWPALAAAGTSSLLLWSGAMGQETGMTTVAFAALAFLLVEHRADPRPGTALWAGLAAGIGALSREYGLAFILFGAGVLLAQRAPRASLLRFAVTAGVVAGPWYLRNWIVTGNPLFPHALGGIFPTNPVHVAMMEAIANYWGVGTSHYDARFIPVVIAIIAGPLVLLGAVGLARAGRAGRPLGAGILLIAGLWWWSIPSTAAGWTYADRVLAPALALCAALAGWLVRTRGAVRIALAAAVTLTAVDAARRSWMLPHHPEESPWPYSFQTWRSARDEIVHIRAMAVWPVLIGAAAGESILVDHPAHHAEITLRNGRALPWFSPNVRAAFTPGRSFNDVRAELRANGVRFVTMMTGNPMSDWFCQRYPFLLELTARHRPTAQVHHLQIYDLDALVPRAGATPPPP